MNFVHYEARGCEEILPEKPPRQATLTKKKILSIFCWNCCALCPIMITLNILLIFRQVFMFMIKECYFCSVCIYQLGMSNRFRIWDYQITASSAYPSRHLQPHMGRLNNPWGSWCINRRHPGPHYMQIYLGNRWNTEQSLIIYK